MTASESAAPKSKAQSPGRARWAWRLGGLGGLALLLLVMFGGANEQAAIPTGDLVPVKRGPLTISMSSAGTIRSAEAVVIKNKVQGSTAILWIIEEGSQVQAGDKLMELDSSELKDEELEELIEVETSRADFVNAEQGLAIAKKQGEADIEAAQVAYRLALLDLEKYTGISDNEFKRVREEERSLAEAERGSILGDLNALAPKVAEDEENLDHFSKLLEQLKGEYKLELKKALNNIIVAKAEASQATETFNDSEKLAAEGYLASQEVVTDKLRMIRAQQELEVAIEELELLAEFTYRRTSEELMSAVNQAKFELERAEHLADANIIDAKARLSSRKERLFRDEQHLKEIQAQLAACVVVAPQEGMVVYGTTGQDEWDRQEPFAEGVEVRERQDLFRLPMTSSLVADIKIHESMLEAVQEGMPVKVTTDALVGEVFEGRIQKIAVLPDSQSRWLNPDLKVYNTVVEVLDGRGRLRTGMSCKAEIIVDEIDDALYVPIQSVVRVAGKPVVYLHGADGDLVARDVSVGLDDKKMIHITDGLVEGDRITLTPPLIDGDSRLASDEQGGNDKSPDTSPKPSAPKAAPAADQGDREAQTPKTVSAAG